MSTQPVSPGVLRIFLIFLRLGLTSFGGPVAHLGYFRDAFVRQRGWLSDRQYSELVALCQILPGPASSQVGMAIGLSQAGYSGLLAAWLGFTLPSALLLILAAIGLAAMESPLLAGVVDGLKVVAVVVVAQAVLGMYRALVSGVRAVLIMLAGAGLILLLPTAGSQLLVIGLGALAGRVWLSADRLGAADAQAPLAQRVTAGQARLWLGLCALLLLALPLLAWVQPIGLLRLLDGLFRAGALVFGGGHVVLPLLQHEVVVSGLVEEGAFLAGYGLAQAVPGPLFTLASYLGAASVDPAAGGWRALAHGLLATGAIFLPAFLLLVGVLPFWDRLRRREGMRETLAGLNAAVVGLLLAALWNPVIVSGIHGAVDFGLLLGLAGLVWCRCPIWAVVLVGGLGGALLTLIG